MLEIERLARIYWDAEESRDTDRILSMFQRDAIWRGPGRRSVGHEEIRGFYEESVAGYPELEVRITETLGSSERAAVEWCAALTDTEGRFHELHGVNLMQARDGKIAELTTYFDPEELSHLLPGPHDRH
jgi:uncharacterized protein (TIGR02246 family)